MGNWGTGWGTCGELERGNEKNVASQGSDAGNQGRNDMQ